MEAIRIRTHLDSETLNLPELRPLVGKDVEIIVLEEGREQKRQQLRIVPYDVGLVDADMTFRREELYGDDRQ